MRKWISSRPPPHRNVKKLLELRKSVATVGQCQRCVTFGSSSTSQDVSQSGRHLHHLWGNDASSSCECLEWSESQRKKTKRMSYFLSQRGQNLVRILPSNTVQWQGFWGPGAASKSLSSLWRWRLTAVKRPLTDTKQSLCTKLIVTKYLPLADEREAVASVISAVEALMRSTAWRLSNPQWGAVHSSTFKNRLNWAAKWQKQWG